jgi:UDP-3-O-[3-hydroxymyristoyl] glucosamine N-acyltransferase
MGVLVNSVAYTLTEIVSRFGGRIEGNVDTPVNQVATLESATIGQIAFLTNSKYRKQLESTHAAAVIVAEADSDATKLPRIVCNNPYSYFAKLSAFFNPFPALKAGIHASAVIGIDAKVSPDAEIGEFVSIGEGATIGSGSVIMTGSSIGANAVIGDNTRLYPHVVVYHDCIVGNNVIIHSGAVIGADGFGFAPEADAWLKIPQIGRAIIGNDVEIGANTTIDRGALDNTVIEDGVKLDNQIQIAHNVHIGAHTVISGCVGIAGSATIGRYCRIGGSAGILGHLSIADGVEISPFTLIGKSIREKGIYSGIFPFSEKDGWLKNAAHLRHLDEMVSRIKRLEKELEDLKKGND